MNFFTYEEIEQIKIIYNGLFRLTGNNPGKISMLILDI